MKVSFPTKAVRPYIRLRLVQLERSGYATNTYRRNTPPSDLRDGYSPEPTLTPIQILARQCRITDRTLYRILNEGKWIKLPVADKLAIGLGYHIGDIWPEYFDE